MSSRFVIYVSDVHVLTFYLKTIIFIFLPKSSSPRCHYTLNRSNTNLKFLLYLFSFSLLSLTFFFVLILYLHFLDLLHSYAINVCKLRESYTATSRHTRSISRIKFSSVVQHFAAAGAVDDACVT